VLADEETHLVERRDKQKQCDENRQNRLVKTLLSSVDEPQNLMVIWKRSLAQKARRKASAEFKYSSKGG
jgi:hypothetical protein